MIAPIRFGRLVVVALAFAVCALAPRLAAAQASITDVLSFLLTNRSVNTGDFAQDTQAAAATRDAMTQFLLAELGTLPISSSSGGFVYRLSPELGVSTRVSDSFGPTFTDRSLTNGAGLLSIGFNYQHAAFSQIDGRALRTGRLVATSASLSGEAQPFDVETLTLNLTTDTMTLVTNLGVTDRIDIGAALPFVRLDLSGTRIDTYRGTSVTQAAATASSLGPGDLILRAKYNAWRTGGSGVAFAGEARLPTGDAANLLGTGGSTFTPRLIVSIEGGRAGLHANVGSAFREGSRDIEYRSALTVAATPRFTIIAEASGGRLSVGRLVDVSAPHPTVPNVTTTRLSSSTEATQRLFVVGGFKWNVASSWLLTASVVRPMSRAGLTTNWTPGVTLDYSFLR